MCVQTTHPEVVTSGAPHIGTIAEHVAHQSWSKVSSEVDGIACLPTEACPIRSQYLLKYRKWCSERPKVPRPLGHVNSRSVETTQHILVSVLDDLPDALETELAHTRTLNFGGRIKRGRSIAAS